VNKSFFLLQYFNVFPDSKVIKIIEPRQRAMYGFICIIDLIILAKNQYFSAKKCRIVLQLFTSKKCLLLNIRLLHPKY